MTNININALAAYSKGVRKLASSYRSVLSARVELAKLRKKAIKALDAMESEERLDWELKHLAKPLAAIFGSTPSVSTRDTITFKKSDGTQCTQSITAYADLRLDEEEIVEKAKEHSSKVNAAAKAIRAKAKASESGDDEEQSIIEIVSKPKLAQLKAIVGLCTASQLHKLIELAEKALSDQEE